MNFTQLELGLVKTSKEFTVFAHSAQARSLKHSLVPHFQTLDKSSQNFVAEIITILVSSHNIETIQRYSRRGGLQNAPLLRAYLWKILLGCLPVQYQKRQHQKKLNYENYSNFINQYHSIDSPAFNKDLWNEIRLDTMRTHPHIDFFKQQINQVSLYKDRPTYHCDVLTRILYIWASLSGVRYVQGMNEILAPFYFLQFQSIHKESESQVFFMYSSFITCILDMHIKDLDNTEIGIYGHMKTLNKYLKAVDFKLWKKLEEQNIIPQFYSFRWLTLMLSQEFDLNDTMKLWDVLLSHNSQRRFKCLYSMCITIIVLRKPIIMQKRYGQIIQKLLKIQDLQVSEIIDISNELFSKIVDLNINKTLILQQDIRSGKKLKNLQ